MCRARLRVGAQPLDTLWPRNWHACCRKTSIQLTSQPRDPCGRIFGCRLLTFDFCERPKSAAGMTARSSTICERRGYLQPCFSAESGWPLNKERVTQMIADPLFEIGNHSWTHANCRLIGGAELRKSDLVASNRVRVSPKPASEAGSGGGGQGRGDFGHPSNSTPIQISLWNPRTRGSAIACRVGAECHSMGCCDERPCRRPIGSPDRPCGSDPGGARLDRHLPRQRKGGPHR
jgi:hypothetical protein